jgi:hypothetical protein
VAEKHWTLETLVPVELTELTSIVPVTTVLAQAGAAPACVTDIAIGVITPDRNKIKEKTPEANRCLE